MKVPIKVFKFLNIKITCWWVLRFIEFISKIKFDNLADAQESTVYHKGTVSKDEISSFKPNTIAFGNNITNQTGKESKSKSQKKRCKSSYNKIAQVGIYCNIFSLDVRISK